MCGTELPPSRPQVHSYAVRSDPLDKDRDAVDGKVVPEVRDELLSPT